MSSTELSRIESGAMAVYDGIENKLAAVEKLGDWFHQSGMLGCISPGQGRVVALACMCERLTPFEFARKYHIISGHLTMRADAQLAAFRGLGGKVHWTIPGDDGQKAVATFELGGVRQEVTYTIDDAKRANLIKSKSAWESDPGSMLRARCVTKAIRMIAPEILAGYMTPEEVETIEERTQQAPLNTPEQVIERRQKIEQSVQSVEAEPIIDVEPAPAIQEPGGAFLTTHGELHDLCALLAISAEQYRAGVKQVFGLDDPHAMTEEQGQQLVAKFTDALEKKRNQRPTAA